MKACPALITRAERSCFNPRMGRSWDFVAQHEDFNILGGIGTSEQHEPVQRADHKQIE